ncbi:hypothetical protein AgCh_024070 [Apium graveolens]
MKVCAIDLKEIWNYHLAWIEFSYDDGGYDSVGMSPYEALYRKRCRSPLYRNEVGYRKMFGPKVVQRTKDIVDLIRGRLVETPGWMYHLGNPWKGFMRFGKKGKLSPQFVGPLDILRHIGELAYELALPPTLQKIHNVFHVAMMKKYNLNVGHIGKHERIDMQQELTYMEQPVRVMD